MTTLADEIARAAVLTARGWFVPVSQCPRTWDWVWDHVPEWDLAVRYAGGLLDSRSTMPLHAPRKPPQQPQAPEGGMMGEMW